MLEDWFAGTRGTITYNEDGTVSGSISYGEHATKWWIGLTVALLIGVLLGAWAARGGVRIVR